MPVEIDQMTSQIDVSSEPAGTGAASGTALLQRMGELKEALRPIIIELIRDELDAYMRTRG
jgi:hypothetical protein